MLLVINHSTDDQDRAIGAIAQGASLLAEDVDLALFLYLREL